MRRIHFNAALIAALAALLMLTACGSGNKEAEPTPPPVLRTPIPTFTPTVPVAAQSNSEASTAPVAPIVAAPDAAAQPAAASAPQVESASANTETPGVGGPLEPPAVVVPVQTALGTINTELVNSRSGPDTSFAVVMILGAGENFDVTGKNADGSWLRICCIQQQESWIKAEFVNVAGSLDALPVAQAGESSGQTVTRSAEAAQATIAASSSSAEAAPVAVEAQPAAQAAVAEPEQQAAAEPMAAAAPAEASVASADVAAASAAGLQLAGQEQFPENNVVRVFLFVYQGTEALEGYTLRVTKDGAEQAAGGTSFGGRPGMTWPIADDRQRFQNLKVEFPGVAAAGTWEVTILKDGAPAGPSATFTLAEGDPNQELYVRYAQP